MIILGIDPGIATTGYGVIKCEVNSKESVKTLDFGAIRTSADTQEEQRLKKIYQDLNELMKKHDPKALAIENVYFFKNAKTAIPVGQSKGVVLLAAAEKELEVYEFTPLQIKTAITGYGKASKKQMQQMIKKHLSLKKIPKPNDAADALGAALCCRLKKENE